MARLRYNLLEGALAADITNVATTITLVSALQEGGVNVPTISGGDIIVLRIDEEVVYLTAYTAGATSGTISRGEEDTVAAAHFAGEPIKNVITKDDFGGAAGSFEVRIAADDSSASDKVAADYICDGVSDEVQFQAAYDSLDNTYGGTIVLASGTYHVGATTNLNDAPVTFRGGLDGGGYNYPETNIMRDQTAANFPMFTVNVGSNDAVTFRDLQMYDDASVANTNPLISVVTVGTLRLDTCAVENDQTAGVAISITDASAAVILDNSDIEADGYCISASAIQITLRAFRTYFYSFDSNALNLVSLTGSSRIELIECRNDGSGAIGYRIDGNPASAPMPDVYIRGGECMGDTGDGIYLSDVYSVDISGMTLGGAGHAVRIENATYGRIHDNFINGSGFHGIFLDACDDVMVDANMIVTPSSATDDTYSGIFLNGDTNKCTITNNKIRSQPSGNKALYGIRIDDSTCDDNFVEGNDLLGASKTTGNEFSDAGTNTRTNGVIVEDVSGTSYTVVASDAGKLKRFTNASLCTITLPVGIPIGFSCELLAWGAAGIDIQDDGTSVVHPEGSVAQYLAASTIVVATSTWSVAGPVT